MNLPRGFAYVEFEEHDDAEKARLHMDGVRQEFHNIVYLYLQSFFQGQIDGNVVTCKFSLPPRNQSPRRGIALTPLLFADHV